MSEIYRRAMDGIGQKVAMQAIRAVVRKREGTDAVKLQQIIEIVHDYEQDAEQAYLAAERRAIEADEAQMRREKVDEMFEGMTEPLKKLTIQKK